MAAAVQNYSSSSRPCTALRARLTCSLPRLCFNSYACATRSPLHKHSPITPKSTLGSGSLGHLTFCRCSISSGFSCRPLKGRYCFPKKVFNIDLKSNSDRIVLFHWFISQKLATFTVLCEQYRLSIKRDPCYMQYLDKIGQIFFGLQPQPRMPTGGLFGNLLQGFLSGLDEDDDDSSLPQASTSSAQMNVDLD